MLAHMGNLGAMNFVVTQREGCWDLTVTPPSTQLGMDVKNAPICSSRNESCLELAVSTAIAQPQLHNPEYRRNMEGGTCIANV